MHGHGKMSWYDSKNSQTKNTYKGDMFANVIQGYGVLTKSNGDSYEGEFENALFNGEGTYMWSNPRLKFKGQFRNGLIHGYGVLHNLHGVYEGEFRKGLMHGKGMITFYNGDKYSGEFQDSTLTGYGCYTLLDGTKVIGHFDDGMCNRHAKKLYPDGRVYIGEFRDDVENGKGLLIDGKKEIKGIWRNAILVEELVSQNVNYENSMALGQYEKLGDQREQRPNEVIKPQEINPPHVLGKK